MFACPSIKMYTTKLLSWKEYVYTANLDFTHQGRFRCTEDTTHFWYGERSMQRTSSLLLRVTRRFLGSEAPDHFLGSVASGTVFRCHFLGLEDFLTTLCLDHCSLLFSFLVDYCNLVLHLLSIFSLLLL
jgi:hypothetical protein